MESKSQTFQLEVGLVGGRNMPEAQFAAVQALPVDDPRAPQLEYFYRCPACHHQAIHRASGPMQHIDGYIRALPGFELKCPGCEKKFVLIRHGSSYTTDEWSYA